MNSARHKLMLGLALVIAVLVLVGWMVHRRPARAVAQYQRQLLAAGEKLKVEDLLPQPAPLESNGAPLFNLTFRSSILGTNVLEKNPPLAMHMVAPSRAAVGWAQPDVRSERTNTWSEVEAALDEYNDTLDLIREAAQKPFFDFCLNYLQGPSLPLPHLAPLKRAVQQLTIATLCDLHDGHVAAATTNLESMLSLVKGTADERLGISQLVRLAMAHISLAATWELLQSTNLTDGQLAAIQHDWAEVEFVQSAENAMALERALGEMTLEQMRNSSAEFRQILSLGGGVPVRFGLSFDQTVNKIVSELAVGTKEARWRWCLSYPDQLRALKGYQALLEAFRQVRRGGSYSVAANQLQVRLAALGLTSMREDYLLFNPSDPDLRSLFSRSVSALSQVFPRVFVMEAGRQMTVTAVALKRYQLRHGTCPGALADLVPEFLPSLPRDPADGQPLRYRPDPDGTFLLYSIGEDGLDNGGDAAPIDKSTSFGWQKGRDFVWPRPATPEQINAFWEKSTKRHRQ